MNNNVWPFVFDDKQYNEPLINGNKCTVNGADFTQSIMKCPELFAYIMDNKQQINPSLLHHIDNISEIFTPVIPMGTIGRIKTAANEWQDEEKHKYVRLDLIHCANFNNRLFPFHDPENQYGFFFINIGKSMNQTSPQLYFDREEKPENDEEHIWCNYDMIDTIYIPQESHDNKDDIIGFKDLQIAFLKNVNNAKVDELIELECETFKVLLMRLRAKVRHGKQGQIKSVQGIIQESLWDSSEEKLENIKEPDDDYSKNPNITSYKLSRHQIFAQYQINPIYLIKVYDSYGKEMKLMRNLRNIELYQENKSFTKAMQKLVLQIAKKYVKSKRVPESINGFNGMRLSFNSSTRGLIFTTNNFTSSVTVDMKKNKVNIFNTSGRNGGW